jgi:hypothetical protein
MAEVKRCVAVWVNAAEGLRDEGEASALGYAIADIMLRIVEGDERLELKTVIESLQWHIGDQDLDLDGRIERRRDWNEARGDERDDAEDELLLELKLGREMMLSLVGNLWGYVTDIK